MTHQITTIKSLHRASFFYPSVSLKSFARTLAVAADDMGGDRWVARRWLNNKGMKVT